MTSSWWLIVWSRRVCGVTRRVVRCDWPVNSSSLLFVTNRGSFPLVCNCMLLYTRMEKFFCFVHLNTYTVLSLSLITPCYCLVSSSLTGITASTSLKIASLPYLSPMFLPACVKSATIEWRVVLCSLPVQCLPDLLITAPFVSRHRFVLRPLYTPLLSLWLSIFVHKS